MVDKEKNYARFLLDTGLGTEIITRLDYDDLMKIIMDGRSTGETFTHFIGIESDQPDDEIKAHISVENKRIIAIVVRKLWIVEDQAERQKRRAMLGQIGLQQ